MYIYPYRHNHNLFFILVNNPRWFWENERFHRYGSHLLLCLFVFYRDFFPYFYVFNSYLLEKISKKMWDLKPE